MDGNEAPGRPEPVALPVRGRAVTMAQVGKLAGVSQVTVSRALSDPSKVSPQTLGRIREAIEVTGFVPNAVAGALASRRSKLVSALVPSITNIVYSSLIRAFSAGMRDEGYQILLSETGFVPEDEEALISTHLSRRPDAMLLTGIHHTAQARRVLLGAGIPVVEVWDITDSPIDLCTGFSHVAAARDVADFARNAGYGHAGTVTANDERAMRRKRAFVERFGQRSGSIVAEVDLPGPATIAGGRLGLARLIEDQGFDRGVVFCSSDVIAHGIIIEAQARGLSIPEEVAVVGFGDQDFAAHVVPSLTTVCVDREELGAAAATAILNRLNGGDSRDTVLDVGFHIEQRQSA